MSQIVGVLSNQENGCSLARSFARKQITVSLLYHGIDACTEEEKAAFCNTYNSENLSVMLDTESFLLSLDVPRRIFLVSPDGHMSDELLPELLLHLDEGDILVDVCDMDFRRVSTRAEKCQASGVHYLSTGFLGGDAAFRSGAALLPGGTYAAYEMMRTVFSEIALKTEGDFSCCPYIGPGGAGQYVKMVHDGIACGLLQLYGEAIYLIRYILQCEPDELIEIVTEWNSGETQSYYLEVLGEILRKYDRETGLPMVDLAMDTVRIEAGARWLIESALTLSVPVPAIHAAVDAGFLSGMKNERVASSKLLKQIPLRAITPLKRKAFLEEMNHMLYTGVICLFAQAFALLKKASDFYGWDLNLPSIAQTFQGNSLIRSRVLYRVIEAFDRRPDSPNLLTDPYFKRIADQYAGNLRDVVKFAVSIGVPVPSAMSAINYLDSYRSVSLSGGIAQLARDYTEGVGFERNDRAGLYHVDWMSPKRNLQSEQIG